MAINITFEAGERRYKWVGGFGAVITSRERNVRVGDLRVIEGHTLYAYFVSTRHLIAPSTVWWSFPEVTLDKIAEFRAKVLG
jgi:hypothetical protein